MRIAVRSSKIEAVSYDDAAKRLTVHFLNGGSYVYHNVEHSTYAAFMAADSKGKFFHANIKGWFPCEKIE